MKKIEGKVGGLKRNVRDRKAEKPRYSSCCTVSVAAQYTPPPPHRRRFTGGAQVRPTLLIDESDFGRDRTSRDMQRLLRGGNRQGSRVLCNGKAFENFGPKVIASRVPLDDAALVSRSINIVMTPTGRECPS